MAPLHPQIQWLIYVGAICPLAYYILAIYCSWDFFKQSRRRPALDHKFAPPVSILKPIRGCDREAYENFASFCRLDYPEYQIIFAATEDDDAAVDLVHRLQADFPGRDIQVITDIPRIGTNRKVNKLYALTQAAKYDTIVFSDADIRVEPDYLWGAVGPLRDPSVGLVTTFFHGIADHSYLSDLDAIGVPAEAAAGALVAIKLEKHMKFAYGWTMATTKQHVAEIGGFQAIANYHSDDFELGNRIAAEGYRVEIMRKPVKMVFPAGNFMDLFKHELRWSIGLRNVRKAGYFGLLLTFGLPWTIAVLFTSDSAAISAAYLSAYVILRLAMAWTVGVWGIGDPVTRRSLWLVPVRDALNTVVWFGGLFSNTISWRGNSYRVRGGLLIPLPSKH